jgi:hypothetical protein
LLAILVVFGLQFFEKGSIPGPLPSDQCFGWGLPLEDDVVN